MKHTARYRIASGRIYSLVNDFLLYALMTRARRLRRLSEISVPYVHTHDFIGASISLDGSYEKYYIDFLRKVALPDLNVGRTCFVDIGANIGNHSLCLGADFERVISIEPALENFCLLKINCPDSKFILYNLALSSNEGFGEIVVDPVNKGGSFLRKADDITNLKNIQAIKVTTLDSLLSDERAIDLVKIDVEGSEYDVLLGSMNILRRHKPVIVFEQNSWSVLNSSASVGALLSGLGYKFWMLSGVSLHEHGSKCQKLGRLAQILLKGPSLRVQEANVIPSDQSYPLIVAFYPR
jgi:FkbM family methyltransferase